MAISNNAEITNTTTDVYINDGNNHYKVSVANQVTIALNGTDYAFDVIGFNHDELTDAAAYGQATATGKAGITLQLHDCFATLYPMNSSNTNSGGWKGSVMRTSTMPIMKGYMPTAWQSVIKIVNKASGLGGGSSSGTETVSDSCFLLAEIEVFGEAGLAVSGEGTLYACYKDTTLQEKYRAGTLENWWERSPRTGGSTRFCFVRPGGTTGADSGSDNASGNLGIAFAFCI